MCLSPRPIMSTSIVTGLVFRSFNESVSSLSVYRPLSAPGPFTRMYFRSICNHPQPMTDWLSLTANMSLYNEYSPKPTQIFGKIIPL